MTLDEAIIHAEDISRSCNSECGREHKKLAEWLKDLKKYQWIPCSERLPELVHKEGLLTGEKQLCTVKRTTRDGKYSGVFVQTEPVLFTEWSGWHLREEDNNERYSTEVIAWMPWPEPYKGEQNG